MENNKKTAIGYVRVSTAEQGNDGKFGVEVQKSKIKDYCSTHGIVLQNVVIEKESGAKERELLNEIAFGEAVSNPSIDYIVVYKNDRVARDMKLYFYYEYVLNKKGIQLLCVEDEFLNGVDSSVATLYKAMMQFVAEQERKNITLRTSNGRLAKAKIGGYSGGKPPYGYKVEDKQLVFDENEIGIVKFIFSLWEANHKSVLNTYNDLMKNKPNLMGRNGMPMSYYTVKSILENKPFYQGLYHYAHLGYVKGQHEAVLPLETDFFEKEEVRIENEIYLEESGAIYD